MVNGQLPLRSTRLKPTDTIWMDSVEPKEQPPSAKDERGLLGARPSFSGNIPFGHWVVGGSEVNCQLLSRSLRLQYKVCMVVDYSDPEYGDSGV